MVSVKEAAPGLPHLGMESGLGSRVEKAPSSVTGVCYLSGGHGQPSYGMREPLIKGGRS